MILGGIGHDGAISEQARSAVQQLLKTQFRPEFLNRLDEIVFYRPLTHENLCAIVDLLVKDLQKRLAARQLSVTVTDAARSYIVEAGSDPVYGARPLKRFLQSRVESLLARHILRDDPAPGACLTVDYDGHELVVR